MFVLALLIEVQVHLVSHKQLVTSVSDIDIRCINLVAISNVEAMEAAANKHRYRMVWAVCGAKQHALAFVCIHQAACHVGTPGKAIGANQNRGWYR